ncbi:MAG: universal stress protein [Proteobacteria bacterium]|nr:universal stress protein [Pseudomonadota bacterium]
MKRILVALDSSPRAPQVLASAVRLAELTGAKLVLFRTIGTAPEVPREIFKFTDQRLEDFLQENAQTELRQLARDVRPELIERYSIMVAVPWDGICRAAREQDADLIVIGSHGFSGIDRLLGTTASKVSNHADRNVLIVRTVL